MLRFETDLITGFVGAFSASYIVGASLVSEVIFYLKVMLLSASIIFITV